MNIEILHDHISTFTREVVDAGFMRDLDDYNSSLPNLQNNIVAMREIAANTLSVLNRFYSSDLHDSLAALLPRKEIRPFTKEPHNVTLSDLVDNKEIPQQEFFVKLHEFLTHLAQQV